MSGFDLEAFLTRQRYQTAHHEAGHAVAAVARGGTFDGLTIEATTTRDGRVHVTYERRHHDFVTFAGPWADARVDWGDRPPNGVDADGSTFHDYLRASLRVNADDLRLYVPSRNLPTELFEADSFGGDAPEIPLARDESWYAELESYWPTMQLMADMVLRGEHVAPEWVRARLGQ